MQRTRYDAWAVFTGSATVLEGGTVVQVYPGLCTSGAPCPGATTNTALCLAVPADPTDPLATNWTKDGAAGAFTGYANPVASSAERDPSSAWRTPAGEWRLTTFGSAVYGSMDFRSWYAIGAQQGFPEDSECPSFFKLPRRARGSGPAPPGAATPTHVLKSSIGGKDWMAVGTYAAGAPRELGNFSATPGVPAARALIDAGALYASKDFYDPTRQRRINLGWAKVAYGPWSDGDSWESSAHTLPREVTWHAELQQLVFAPLDPEQASLRGAVLGELSKPQLLPAGGAPLSLGLAPRRGNQSEVLLSFARPSSRVTLTLRVMADGSGAGGTDFTIRYAPPAAGSNGSASSVEVASGSTTDTLRLSPTDTTLELRVFVDNVFSEAYWQGGRVAMTVPSPPPADGACGITVMADAAGAQLLSAVAYEVKSIWVSADEVLGTPRPDGGDVKTMLERISAEQLTR